MAYYPSTYDARDVMRLARKRLSDPNYARFMEHYRVAHAHQDYEEARLGPLGPRELARAGYVLRAITLAELMGALARLLHEQRKGEAP